MIELHIVLLAAGQSSRMQGRDKLMELIDGEPLLRRTARRAYVVAPVTVALPPPPHPRYDALAGLELRHVSVPDANEGMNASLRAGIRSLPASAEAAMVLLADLPGLTENDMNIIANAVDIPSQNTIWRGSTEDGKPGHPVVFSHALFDELIRLTGDEGAQSVVRAHKDQVQMVRLTGQAARTDLDTPAAWAAWRAANPDGTGD